MSCKQKFYFFACIEYTRSMDNYHNSVDGCNRVITSNVFKLDHYPSEGEICKILYGYGDHHCIVVSYSELNRGQYKAYNAGSNAINYT
jgi:hypothetical protein